VTANDSSRLLDPSRVLLELNGPTFETCLEDFRPLINSTREVKDADAFLDAVRAREKSHSTATVDGVAFPHARTNAVSGLFLVVGQSRKGVNFGPDSPTVNLIFLIGVPPDAAPDYLECVAWLAGRCRNPQVLAALKAAKTPETFVAMLTDAAL
jgi:mannitol/fructose-specific phosphotransferase system IIA component (Ntr-type)